METWREALRNKPVRCWSRTEIEEIVKEKKIDRTRFYEYSKTGYSQVIKRFYYSFADYKKHPGVQLHYLWLHFREELRTLHFERNEGDWEALLGSVKRAIPYDWHRKVFLILSDGWVYEGFIDEIISVLTEADALIDCFYIVTPEYDKVAAYSGDGDCILILAK